MKKRFLALALGTLAFGVTLGGVKMGLGHQDAMMVKAAEGKTLLTSLTFSKDTNSDPISSYTNSWTGTASGGYVFNITNFNNNKNGWAFIKCGSKKGASVASIETKEAIAKPIGRIALTIGAITKDTAKINSIKLEVRNAENQLIETIDLTNKTADTHDFLIKTPAENLKYKFVFDCQQGTSNGMIQVDQIDFYSTDAAGGESEPVAPVARIAATANAGSEFYAGTKVSLSDFTFVGFDADGKETTLAGDITIENPLLVEGKNTIKFIYQSGETSINFECEVNAIKTTIYAKTTDVQDIAAGKRILIAGNDGKAVLGSQTGSSGKTYRNQVLTTPKNDVIFPTDGFVPLLIVPAKDGFVLYDETSKGVLCSVSSDGNYIGTQTNFEKIDESAFATFSTSDKNGRFDIQFAGSNEKRILSYNASAKRFSCYGASQAATLVYVSNEDPVSFKAETWADSFIANVSSKCDATGATATWTADWDKAKAVFDGFGIPDKMAVLYGAGSEKVNQAVATYKFIVDKYNVDDYLGLGTGTTAKANALMLPGATDSTTWSLVAVGAVTIAASASLLFFRRKKSN